MRRYHLTMPRNCLSSTAKRNRQNQSKNLDIGFLFWASRMREDISLHLLMFLERSRGTFGQLWPGIDGSLALSAHSCWENHNPILSNTNALARAILEVASSCLLYIHFGSKAHEGEQGSGSLDSSVREYRPRLRKNFRKMHVDVRGIGKLRIYAHSEQSHLRAYYFCPHEGQQNLAS